MHPKNPRGEGGNHIIHIHTHFPYRGITPPVTKKLNIQKSIYGHDDALVAV
jgi:hypothetical protein